jgi:hypothetical protein
VGDTRCAIGIHQLGAGTAFDSERGKARRIAAFRHYERPAKREYGLRAGVRNERRADVHVGQYHCADEMNRRHERADPGHTHGSTHFSLETLKQHRLLRIPAWCQIRSARLVVILSVPFIYALLIPFFVSGYFGRHLPIWLLSHF